MKKLPEFIALGIGIGLLSLAGSIAWMTVEADRSTLTAAAVRAEQVQAASVLRARR